MLHGFTPPARFLPYLSSPEIAALPDAAQAVVVLPVGAIEQHGPHLPCAVDSLIAAGVVGHALARLPDAVAAYALPPLVYGTSDEHADFAGTLGLSPAVLQQTVEQIGDALHRAGLRKLLVVNGHGGNPEVLALAARALRVRHGDFVVVPHFVWHVPNPYKDFMDERERRLGLHAGQAETALMLALAPELVRMERAVACHPPEFAVPTLSPNGRPACAWTARDIGSSGVIGDPRAATAEQGHAILDALAASWAQAITELHALRWVQRPAT